MKRTNGLERGYLVKHPASGVDIEWLVTDQLGTPRMIADQTGALSGVKRHDYLPFGEELYAGISGRTTQQGYTGDSLRQKFTQYERDNETNLDFAESRYYSSLMGRFTSPDESFADQEEDDPQSWNLYTYVRNNPLRFIDSTGEGHIDPKTGIYVGDKDGECEDGLCWDEKNQAWVDNVPVNGGTVHETYDQTSSTPLIAGGVLAWNFSPPPVKLATAGMGVLIGVAALAAYFDRDMLHLPAPFVGPFTIVNPTKIDIVGPLPPPVSSKNKSRDNKRKADGLITAAAVELGKLMSDPPGPGGPGDHHKEEIKAMLDRAKRLVERFVGKSKADRLKKIDEIDKAVGRH